MKSAFTPYTNLRLQRAVGVLKVCLVPAIALMMIGSAAAAGPAGAETSSSSFVGDCLREPARGASGIPSYYSHLDFNLTGPSARATAVGGYANPAVYALMPGGELEWFFTHDDDTTFDRINRWGLFLGAQNIGFGAVYNRAPGLNGLGELSVVDYRLALSLGTKNLTFGTSLGWSSGDTDQFRRSRVIQIGTVARWNRYLSTGLVGTFSTQKDDQAGLLDVAVRPLGNHYLSLFGDLELPKGIAFENAPWSAGAVVEVVEGLKLVGRYFENESYGASVVYTFGGGLKPGHVMASASPRFDKNDDYAYTNYGVRIGFPERTIVDTHLQKDRYYLNLNLKGSVVHSRYKYFDSGQSLHSLLTSLDHARNDSRVKGVAINLSGSKMSRGTAWEVRKKLSELRAAGKHVVVFIDEAEMTTYYLASVADRVVMDPEGIILLPGYVLGRTYLANLLEKLGLGFDEWRFLKYKSAVESLSRHGMSDADREQRQALVDGYYETARNDVSASRGVSPTTFDRWVDEITVVFPSLAMEEGIVDQLGRWEDVKDVIEELEGSRKSYIGAEGLAGNHFKSKRWGEEPRVALVYALGECAMDSGIKARRLEKIFQGLRDDKRVKAVVFRVNSPGGSGMASDVVVQALKGCAEQKPVVVSQADVAASGGYWISMCADEIVAQPTTITGSIGVIGGWIYNDGLGDKVGLEGDFVQRGKSADLMFALKPPYLPVAVPHRNLSTEERARIMEDMEIFYRGFVEKVAENRGMTPEAVEAVAQGRVWTGVEGKKRGLVDRIGGLEVALDVAKEKAGIGADDEVKIVEYGTKGWFNFKALNPLPFSMLARWFGGGEAGDAGADEDVVDFLNDYETIYLREILKNNGRAMCLIPPEYIPKETRGFGE